MTEGSVEASKEYSRFEPVTSRVSSLFPEIELPYNMGSRESPAVHPFCLCAKDSVIVAKQAAYWAPNHVYGSCPIEKCNRANGLGDLTEAARVGAVTVDGCLRGVTMPPYTVSLDPNVNARNQRAYGTYETYCNDPLLVPNQRQRR